MTSAPAPSFATRSSSAPAAAASTAAARRATPHRPSRPSTSSRVKGGLTELAIGALACQGCNNHKYQKTEAIEPATNELALLYHPRQDRWDEHFASFDDFALLIGLTPTGRATSAALFLNRKGVVNLHRLLYTVGEHPPPLPEDAAE